MSASTMMPRNFLPGTNSALLADEQNSTDAEMLAAIYAARAASSAQNQLTPGGLSSASNALLLSTVLADEQRRQTLLLAAQLPALTTTGLSSSQQDRLRGALMIQQRNAEQQAMAGASLRLNNMAPADNFGGLSLNNLGLSDNSLLTQQARLAAAAQQHSALLGVPSPGTAAAEMLAALGAAPQEERTGRKGRTGTFPQKMHQMLSDLEKEEGGTEIACFLPHGRAFAIHKPKEFVKTIMPKYFRMSRFSSFQRQLNLYDFQRITEGPDKGAYFHELFVKGRPMLSTQIKRNKIKGVTSGTTTAPRGGGAIVGRTGTSMQQLGLGGVPSALGALGLASGLALNSQQAANQASLLRSLGGGGSGPAYPPV